MAGIEHQVHGPTKVKYNALELGYSRDGVQIRIEPRWIDIFSDDWGGASGAPADAQIVGAIATVQCELTHYDMAEVEKLTAFYSGAGPVAGTLPVFGTLMRQSTKYAALLLVGTSRTVTFTHAIIRQGQEVNKGTRFSTFVCGFECWLSTPAARLLFAEAAS